MSELAVSPTALADSPDAQCTPRDLALELGTFSLDPCSSPRSHIQSLHSYQLERGENGLELDWRGSVYCNPPYSNPMPWVERLREHRNAWCALVKLDPTTKWWQRLIGRCDAWAPFRKRLAYERPGNCGSANFASALVWGGFWRVPTAVLLRLWVPNAGDRQWSDD